MPQIIQVLLVEDDPNDAELVLRHLRLSGFEPVWQRVDTEADFLASLRPDLDLILSDFQMPQFSGLRALELLVKTGLEIPFILVSGTIGEDTAVMAMKQGAVDYLIKDRLTRLGQAVGHALEQNRLRLASRKTTEELSLFRTLVDRSNDAFEVIDPKTARFLDMNAKGCTDLGLTREEALRLRVFDIDPMVTEETWPDVIKLLKTQGSAKVERLHVRKDGTSFPVEVSIKLVKLDKEYVVSMVRDITERKQAEDALRESETRFRQLAENIQEVFWMTNATMTEVLYVSPAYEAIWGRTCQSLREAPLQWIEAINPKDRDRVMEAAANQEVLGKYDEVYRIHRPDGTQRWIHDRGYPIKDEEGKIYRIVGTAADVTEQHALEEQLRQAQKMEALGTLSGGIAHDFNNILAAMNGYTELAKMTLGTSNPRVSDSLDSVLKAGNRAVNLVRQILTFSRQEEHQRRPLQLRDVVEETLKLLRATIPVTIEFKTSLEPDLPAVLADSTQIHQILMNLGTNAWHAMRNKIGRLEVKLENFDADARAIEAHPRLKIGRYVRLSVSDTGTGMNQATMDRIFEPFFTTKPTGEGTGLGLSVVHGIMESHEGLITVQSQLGEGTTFQLYFPTCTTEIGQMKTTAAVLTPLGSNKRILYVDDEEALAQLGKKTLEQLGYQVEMQTDATVALDWIRTNPQRVDLVITDQTMPGMTGIDFAAELQKIRPDLPIILATGNSTILSPEQLQAAGIRELMMKPQSLLSLASAVHRALATKKQA